MIHRRDFLRFGVFSGITLASGVHVALSRSTREDDDPLLVVIELNGGNDDLNTLVPFGDDIYYRARPVLAVPKNRVHAIDRHMGWAPPLEGLSKLFHEGKVLVLPGVGMPDPDRSHFTSLDRWHAGDAARHPRGDGWLGRALDQLPTKNVDLSAISLGERELPRLLRGTQRPVAAALGLKDLTPKAATRDLIESPFLEELDGLWARGSDQHLIRESKKLLAALEGVVSARPPVRRITNGPLGSQLQDALKIIVSGLRVPALFVRFRGFDTHARQDRVHDGLLAQLDGALSPFFRAVLDQGAARRVLVLVYSEFSRRVAENGSRGTDHGSAGSVLLLGGGLRGGFLGKPPDLANLDEGDVRVSLDFRRVLAQALKHLGHQDPQSILGPLGVPMV